MLAACSSTSASHAQQTKPAFTPTVYYAPTVTESEPAPTPTEVIARGICKEVTDTGILRSVQGTILVGSAMTSPDEVSQTLLAVQDLSRRAPEPLNGYLYRLQQPLTELYQSLDSHTPAKIDTSDVPPAATDLINWCAAHHYPAPPLNSVLK